MDVFTRLHQELELRNSKGYETYKQRLEPNNGRDVLLDMYEEFLDFMAYFTQYKMEVEQAEAAKLQGSFQLD